ncbi:MAG: carbon-phosphorus lyase complex accessory protein [Firmicutes bacterium ADurb.Bin182]|nr:MAG: carbon-phosphorus lyase complex accessory protein [Firmicutes bacterium ADurb.Bin182]
MKFQILGSGGCVSTPKPLCGCGVCKEAREKGTPYSRCGCSLYFYDLNLLVDTPEDIGVALNRADIKAVDHILYSHWDPDHTMGIRVMEHLRLEWLSYYEGIIPENPVILFADPGVMNDLNLIRNRQGAFLNYYENLGLIKRFEVMDSIDIAGVRITLVSVPKRKAVSVFAFEKDGRKLIYAPCDCRPFPYDIVFYNADVLIIGNTFVGDVLKNGKIIDKDHPLRSELHSMEDVLAIKDRFNIKRVIVTHIEEDWGKSFDDYKELEKEYENVTFAYDGLVIEL